MAIKDLIEMINEFDDNELLYVGTADPYLKMIFETDDLKALVELTAERDSLRDQVRIAREALKSIAVNSPTQTASNIIGTAFAKMAAIEAAKQDPANDFDNSLSTINPPPKSQ